MKKLHKLSLQLKSSALEPFHKWAIPVALIMMAAVNPGLSQKTDTTKTSHIHWSGYIKHMHSSIYQPATASLLLDGLFQHRLNFTASGPDSPWLLHAGLRTRMFYGNYFELTPDQGKNIHDENNDHLPLSINVINRERLLLNSYLDRFYLQWTRKDWEVRLGRQRINWGISNFWNPNDLFNTFDFTDFDYDERPGSDAVRVTWYSGPVSRLEGAMKIADDWDSAIAALLYRWNSGSFDYQIIAGKYQKNITLGGGWSGYLGNVGFKGEFMHFNAYNSKETSAFNATAGLDYAFKNKVFTGIGYLFNEAGSTGQGTYLFAFKLSARNLYPYRHAVYTSINYGFAPLLNGGVSLVYSPAESKPFFISPTLSYNMAQNWDLDLISQIFVTDTPPGSLDLNIYSFFLRVKWSM